MSFSKEPPVDDGPIPFGNPGQPGGSGHQGFFGSQQQQQQQQPNPATAPPSSSGYSQSASGNAFYGNSQMTAQGAYATGGQQTPLTNTAPQSAFFDQYQNQPVSNSQATNHQQVGQGPTLTQSYDPSLYHHYAESVMSGDTNYQQQYQSFDPAQQQYYQQYQQQPYDTNQQQQYNYGQQPQYDYSQQQQAYDYNASQQPYDYSQHQQQYDYSQQQYDYGQQQTQYEGAQSQLQQQPYDAAQYDTSQQQYGTTQQQHDTAHQQQYDATQQQTDTTHQQQYDVTQQQSDTTHQQQHDLTQQQYDSSQQYDYNNQVFANEQQHQPNGQPEATVTEPNAVDWNQWNDQQAAPVSEFTSQDIPATAPIETATHQQQEPLEHQPHSQHIGGDIQPQFDGQSDQKPTKPEQPPTEHSFDQGPQTHQLDIHGTGQEQTIYEYVDQEGYQHVGFQPPEQQYGDKFHQGSADQPTDIQPLQAPVEQPATIDQTVPDHIQNQSFDAVEPIKEEQRAPSVDIQPEQTTIIPGFQGDTEPTNNALGVHPNHLAPTFATATPTLTSSRINSPQSDFVAMVPCPDPNCEGENKPRAKFCSECGRPLSNLSRASTPFSPQSHAYTASPSYAMHHQQSPYLQQAYYGQQQQQPDPLQRNKGCPLATFGFGGKLCVMFPSKLHSQDANSKIMPGLVQLKHLTEVVLPDASSLSDFIGPVVLDNSMDISTKQQAAMVYMDGRIQGFHTQLQGLDEGSIGYRQLETRALLWQLVRTLIENMAGDSDSKETAIYHLMQYGPRVIQANALGTIRDYLIQGDRSSASHYAMQEKLWSHGLILGKSVDDTLWKTVVDQFVEHSLSVSGNEQTDANPVGDLASLRVLYALFAGAGGDAVSHFIPKHSPRPIEEHLAEWRETLTLILANRPAQAGEAIKRLGALLKENKWIDAAEICSAILASTSLLADENLISSELIGSQEGDVSAPLDALYLTELYEFALSFDQQNNVTILPFLQGYKLVHAWWLADAGFIPEASRYLQAIISGLLSYDKPNSYLHQGFVDNLKEFSNLIRDSSDSSIGIDLDSSLQQLEAKLKNMNENGQNQVAPLHDDTDTAKEVQDTVVEPTSAKLDQQEPESVIEQTQVNGYQVADVYDTTHYAVDNTDYASQYQYDQGNNMNEQVDHGYGYETQPNQEQANEWQHNQQQANEWHHQDQAADIVTNDETKVSDLSHAYQHDEPAQEASSNSNEAPSESIKVSAPSVDDSAAQDTQPATLSATQDYSMPSYGAGEYTMTYDSQDYTTTYTAQDNSEDYVTTTYIAQDYTTTYQAQDYSNTYEAHQGATAAQDTAAVEPSQENASIQAHDHGHAHHDTYQGQDYTQDPSSTYESQPPAVAETTQPVNDTGASFEAHYASMPTRDYSSSYEPNGSYGNEPTMLSTYTQEYTPSSHPPEPSTAPVEEETKPTAALDEDDGLGLGNTSTKKSFPAEAKTDEDKPAQQQPDVPKDGKSTDDEGDEDDKQDRKGWGLFSMFSRASPAPMDKDEKKAVKANLGETSSFYFDEKEGRWVNKNVSDTPAAPTKLPPPPKSASSTPQPPPPPPPATVSAVASPPPPATPPADRPPLQDLMNTPPPTARRGPASGKKKPMRSRYVDVFNAPS